jgi:predicted MFS family arabinose efflux permease
MLTGILSEHSGWRFAFKSLGVMTLVGAMATARWLPASRSFVRQSSWRAGLANFGHHLRNPLLIATYAVGFSVLFSLVATFTYITFHLAAAPYHLGPFAQGALFFVYLLGLFVTPASGHWIHKLGSRKALTIAVAMSTVGVLLTLASPLWLIVVGLALCSSGVFVCQTAASSFVGRAADRARSAAAGLYVTFYYIGGSAGAVLPGDIWSHAGWPGCVALIVAVQVIAGSIAWRFWRN